MSSSFPQHNRYVVAAVKPWNIEQFHKNSGSLPGQWELVSRQEDLTLAYLRKIGPRYIFFPHWSWVVPSNILAEYECVCFHMTDVPFGRGGSPLQNLIKKGYKKTKLTALKMVRELDAGPIYAKLELDLAGSAESIFYHVAELCYVHIRNIIANEPSPVEQEGEVLIFPRRSPGESLLPKNPDLGICYDHIRMLDAPTYPKAFIEHGDLVLEFSAVKFSSKNKVEAKVTIRQKPV